MAAIGLELYEGRPDRIRIESGFRDKDNVQMIPGSRWDKDDRVWHLPLSWAAMQQARGVFGDRLTIGPQLSELAQQVLEQRVQPSLALRFAEDCEWIREYCQHSNGTDELTPLQRAAAGFLVYAQQAFEGDDMGTGKTPVTISALRYAVEVLKKDPFPLFIVCNNAGVPHWRNEFHDWWRDGPGVALIKGNAKQRKAELASDAEVFVINWESLTKHTRLSGYGNIKLSEKDKEPKELNEMGFRSIVADEIHRGKNPKAKQTRGMFAVSDPVAKQGGIIWGLTGSIIANSPADLWGPGHIVAPAEYPSKVAFVERYGLLSWNYFGSMTVVGLRGDTRDELFRFLDPRLIRRPKEKILPQLEGKLPPMTRLVDLLPKQRKAYNKLRDEMLVELDNGVLRAKNPMARMQRLRTFAGATGDIDDDGEFVLKEPSSKLDALVDELEDLGEDQVVVYAESRKLIELAAARLTKESGGKDPRLPGITFEQFTGKNAGTREAHREAFQAGKVRVLLLTYGAGAESINLSQADCLIRLELSWSAIKNSQALERPQRPGRKGPLRQVDIIAEDTVDAIVKQKYEDKLAMLEEVVRDEETLRRWLER